MAKANAYSLFVFDTAKRRRAQGIPVDQARLFQELDEEWRNLPDHVKDRYKQRANNSSNQSSAAFAERREKAFANPPSAADIKKNIKMESGLDKKTSQANASDTKANIVESKEELMRGIKRSREEDPSDDKNEFKKPKVRPGIPNWKNIKDKSTIEPVKYLQKHSYDLRQTCQAILRSRNDKSVKTPFYAFSVNLLCKQKRAGKETFIPLEIGIFAYSIEDGPVGEPYHVIINSGKIPPGCLNISTDHASISHKISIPNRIGETRGYPECARSDIRKIYKEMIDYTKRGERTILIENNYHMAQVKGSLDWIYNKACEEPGVKLAKPSSWTVMPIAEFIAGLTNSIRQDLLGYKTTEFGIHYYLRILLEGSIYDYNHHLMCEFHEIEENRSHWCARSCAQRMIMNLSEALKNINRLLAEYKSRQVEALEPPQEQLAITHQQVPSDSQQALVKQQGQQPTQMITDSDEEPILAIEGNPMLLPPPDPRLGGLVHPTIEPLTTIDIGEDLQFVVETITEPVKKPKKKEPLIIASTPACTGNTRDVF